MAASTSPASAGARSDQTITESLAKEARISLEEVARLYDQELAALAAGAKITQFLGVLATRRVRMILRRH